MERRSGRAVLKVRLPQQKERILQRLAATPVEELAKGFRVHVSALRRGNVRTVADVYQRTINDLDDIRDVGPKSAHKIKALATEFAEIRPDDLCPPSRRMSCIPPLEWP
jgi:hypothetical protein